MILQEMDLDGWAKISKKSKTHPIYRLASCYTWQDGPEPTPLI